MNILKYIGYRLLALILQVIGAIAIIFSAMGLVKYDPVAIFVFNLPDSSVANEALINEFKASLGLDLPLYERFALYLSRLLGEGSLGTSWWDGTEVGEMYFEALSVTLSVFGLGFLLYTMFALVIGVTAASKVNSRFDKNFRFFTSMFYSVPPYVLGAVLIYFTNEVIVSRFDLTEQTGVSEFIVRSILPILTVILIYTGFQFRLVRIYMLNVLNQNYIRTAISKGLTQRKILVKHAMLNAVPELITSIALTFPVAFSGIAVLEKVFEIKGSGLLLINYSLLFDWPVVIGGAVIFTIINASLLAITDMIIYQISPQRRLGKITYQ
jgi:peptide/nickel transport system permease protein